MLRQNHKGESQVDQVQDSSSSQFLTGPLLIRSRYRQDCVRREEAEHEGEEEIEMSPKF